MTPLTQCLRRLGLAAGDVAYLGIDLGGLKPPALPLPRNAAEMRARREAVFLHVYDAVRAVVGEAGTILVPAFSYDYARNATPYDHETTPSEVGPFTEWFRTRPGVIRSLHPLFSVCGEGPVAAAILDNCGRSAFGPTSPFGRLSAHDVKFVSLGVHLAKWFTYAHHLEQLAGCNHAYHKLFNVPVSKAGRPVEGPFLAYLRYLGAGIDLAIAKFEDQLRAAGVLREDEAEGLVQIVTARDAERVGLDMLATDPWAFIARPVEVHVETPGGGTQPYGRAAVHRLVPA